MSPTIEPVRIGLLERHGSLPDAGEVLARFAGFHRASLERARAASAAAEVAAPEVAAAQEAVEEVADIAALAADAMAQGLVEAPPTTFDEAELEGEPEETFLDEGDPSVDRLFYGDEGGEDVDADDTFGLLVEAGDEAAAADPAGEVPASDDAWESGRAVGEDAAEAELHEVMEGHVDMHEAALVDQASLWNEEEEEGEDLISGDYVEPAGEIVGTYVDDDGEITGDFEQAAGEISGDFLGAEETTVVSEAPEELQPEHDEYAQLEGTPTNVPAMVDDEEEGEGTVMMQAVPDELLGDEEEEEGGGTVMMQAVPDELLGDDEEEEGGGTVMMPAMPDEDDEEAEGTAMMAAMPDDDEPEPPAADAPAPKTSRKRSRKTRKKSS